MILLSLLASICTFIPPEGWDCVPNSHSSSYIQVGFLGKGKAFVRPSLNLAIEKTDLSLKAYLKAVRSIHETEMNVQWRDLGSFSCRAGQGRLTEISSPSPSGEIKMLQTILMADGYAYILTGAALKEEFASQRQIILNVLRSLTLSQDLFSMIPNLEQKDSLIQLFTTFKGARRPEVRQQEWEQLQTVILGESFKSLGDYWRFLVLKEGYERIFRSDEREEVTPLDKKSTSTQNEAVWAIDLFPFSPLSLLSPPVLHKKQRKIERMRHRLARVQERVQEPVAQPLAPATQHEQLVGRIGSSQEELSSPLPLELLSSPSIPDLMLPHND